MATTTKKSLSAEAKPAPESAGTGLKKAAKKDDNYTEPDLRERLKEEIKAGEKGGKASQWSARKAQLPTQRSLR